MKEETGADIIDVKEEPLDEEYLEEDIILVKEWIYSTWMQIIFKEEIIM